MRQPAHIVSSILDAQIEITPDLAESISAALGTSTELWLNLEAAYRSHTSVHGA